VYLIIRVRFLFDPALLSLHVNEFNWSYFYYFYYHHHHHIFILSLHNGVNFPWTSLNYDIEDGYDDDGDNNKINTCY